MDTEALIKGVRSGVIGMAGLDVYEREAGYFFRDCSDTPVQVPVPCFSLRSQTCSMPLFLPSVLRSNWKEWGVTTPLCVCACLMCFWLSNCNGKGCVAVISSRRCQVPRIACLGMFDG